MIKRFAEQDMRYEVSEMTFKDGATAQVTGKIEAEKKASKNGVNMLLKLSDNSGKVTINQLVFNNNPLYTFFEPYVGQKMACIADIKFVTNVVGDKKYQAIEIHNIECDVPSEEDIKAAAEKKYVKAAAKLDAQIAKILKAKK